jgi:hypothetical protein
VFPCWRACLQACQRARFLALRRYRVQACLCSSVLREGIFPWRSACVQASPGLYLKACLRAIVLSCTHACVQTCMRAGVFACRRACENACFRGVFLACYVHECFVQACMRTGVFACRRACVYACFVHACWRSFVQAYLVSVGLACRLVRVHGCLRGSLLTCRREVILACLRAHVHRASELLCWFLAYKRSCLQSILREDVLACRCFRTIVVS